MLISVQLYQKYAAGSAIANVGIQDQLMGISNV
jgi:hypothetical protein